MSRYAMHDLSIVVLLEVDSFSFDDIANGSLKSLLTDMPYSYRVIKCKWEGVWTRRKGVVFPFVLFLLS